MHGLVYKDELMPFAVLKLAVQVAYRPYVDIALPSGYIPQSFIQISVVPVVKKLLRALCMRYADHKISFVRYEVEYLKLA